MFLNYGLANSEFLNNFNENTLTWDNPLIFVCECPITHQSQVIKILEYVKSIDRPLIIFSPEIRKEPLSLLLYNIKRENLLVLYLIFSVRQ